MWKWSRGLCSVVAAARGSQIFGVAFLGTVHARNLVLCSSHIPPNSSTLFSLFSITFASKLALCQDVFFTFLLVSCHFAHVSDIISRLPGCSGQAADAVSAHAKVRMEDASTLFKTPKSECPNIWIRLSKHKWPKSWFSMEDPVVPLERNLYGHSSGRTTMGKAI